MNDVLLPELLPHLLSRVWPFALRISNGNLNDAESLTERAFADAFKKTPNVSDDAASLRLTFGIICSIWLSEMQGRNGSCPVLQRDIVPDAGRGKGTALRPHAQVSSDQIVRAVQRLPEDQRLTVLLVDVERFSQAEAAEILDVSVETIAKSLCQARQAIGSFVRRKASKAYVCAWHPRPAWSEQRPQY
jgi:RNA polymerase sigma-70 factor (ECF subfamily)